MYRPCRRLIASTAYMARKRRSSSMPASTLCNALPPPGQVAARRPTGGGIIDSHGRKKGAAMRKRIIGRPPEAATAGGEGWLDLEALAQVEVTSEDPAHSVESALAPDTGPGWRASESGRQTIRLLFDTPQRLRRIFLLFPGGGAERTQEFVLRWATEAGGPYRDVVRQQYNFSPAGAAREVEDYRVELDAVAALELEITPDVGGGGDARASLSELRLA